MKLGVSDSHLQSAGIQPMVPQACGHGISQHGNARLHLNPCRQILRKCGAVADRLGRLGIEAGANGRAVQAIGVGMELQAHFAKKRLQRIRAAGSQLADGLHAIRFEKLFGGAAHVQKVSHRQRPYELLPIFTGDHSGGVRLAVIASKFGKDLVEANAYGECQPQFPPDTCTQGVRKSFGISAKEVQGMGHIQPAFVNAKGLH